MHLDEMSLNDLERMIGVLSNVFDASCMLSDLGVDTSGIRIRLCPGQEVEIRVGWSMPVVWAVRGRDPEIVIVDEVRDDAPAGHAEV